MNRLRRIPYANEAVGALVLIALGLFFAAVLQGGVLRQWFNPTASLRVVLPEQGLSGLAAGAPIEIIGTKAGEVRRIPRNSFSVRDGWKKVPPSARARMARTRVSTVTSLRSSISASSSCIRPAPSST